MISEPLYGIVGWSDHFENNRTRIMKRMQWVPIPNQFDGDKISELVERGGADVYGAWCALLLVAGRCQRRGVLIRSGGAPHDSKSLARITKLPAEAFERCFEIGIDVGLIEQVSLSEIARVDLSSQTGQPGTAAAVNASDAPSGTALADRPADDSRRFPNNWCHEVMNQYPRHRRGGPVKAYEVIREALTRIEARFNEPREAVEWLTSRVKAYAASPAGKAGRHVVSLQRWMQEGRYDEDAEAWQIGADDEPRAGKSQPPSAAYQRQPTAEERRIQAKRLAAIEKRKQKGGA